MEEDSPAITTEISSNVVMEKLFLLTCKLKCVGESASEMIVGISMMALHFPLWSYCIHVVLRMYVLDV